MSPLIVRLPVVGGIIRHVWLLKSEDVPNVRYMYVHLNGNFLAGRCEPVLYLGKMPDGRTERLSVPFRCQRGSYLNHAKVKVSTHVNANLLLHNVVF